VSPKCSWGLASTGGGKILHAEKIRKSMVGFQLDPLSACIRHQTNRSSRTADKSDDPAEGKLDGDGEEFQLINSFLHPHRRKERIEFLSRRKI